MYWLCVLLTGFHVHFHQAHIRVGHVQVAVRIEIQAQRTAADLLLVEMFARFARLHDRRDVVADQFDDIAPVKGCVQFAIVIGERFRSEQVAFVPKFNVLQFLVDGQFAG